MFKPNPSLVGKSRFPHNPLWLASEREILEWWGTVRTQMRVPIPINPRDGILLIYEKEVLEWWHSVRQSMGYSQETAVGVGTGVWNSPLHQQYETELAQWWLEEEYPVIYEDLCDEDSVFLALPNLVGYWPMRATGGGIDRSPNENHLSITGSVPFAIHAQCGNYAQLTTGNKLARSSLGSSPTTAVSLGAWVRMKDNNDGFRAVMGINGIYQLQTWEQNGDAQGMFWGTSATVSHPENAFLAQDTWYFIVATSDTSAPLHRIFVGGQANLTNPTNIGSQLASSGNPFEINGGSIGFDISMAFVTHSTLSLSTITNLYDETKSIFE